MGAKVFLTGGAGDLGQMLCPSLIGMGHSPIVFDPRMIESGDSDKHGLDLPQTKMIEGSILDRRQLKQSLLDNAEIEVVVHIAAWHGIHQARGEKTAYDFFDLNVGGTFNVFQLAHECGIKKAVLISSTSVDEPWGVYGHSKVLAEEIAKAYAHRHGMSVIILRPRAFIPPWNRAVYESFIDWAKWFCKGAVHISDVNQALVKSVDLLLSGPEPAFLAGGPLTLTVDGAYQFSDEDLANWDADGPGSTFKKHYGQYYEMALKFGLDPALKPKKLDISETTRCLNYKPLYSLKTLLMELKQYGEAGPYADRKS